MYVFLFILDFIEIKLDFYPLHVIMEIMQIF